MGWQEVILRMQCSSSTHWGRVTHICVSELAIIGSDNGLLPGRRQAVVWNNAGLLWIEPLGTNFSEISIRIQTFSFKKNALEHVICEMTSILSQPQCVKLLPGVENVALLTTRVASHVSFIIRVFCTVSLKLLAPFWEYFIHLLSHDLCCCIYHICTVAYLGHGEKTNYSANPPGRNTNPPGRNNQSARAE